MIEINATFAESQQSFGCDFDSGQEFDARMDGILAGDYTGEYEFTPSNETQLIPTAGKTVTLDIVVKPIPQNYGLISWNGSTLTIS